MVGDPSDLLPLSAPADTGSGRQPSLRTHVHKQAEKTTRVRTVLNEKQLHTLRTCYAANPRPDALMKEQLVEMTGLSPRVIRVWFQNKRCKDKKKSILMKQLQQQQHSDKAVRCWRWRGGGRWPPRHSGGLFLGRPRRNWTLHVAWHHNGRLTLAFSCGGWWWCRVPAKAQSRGVLDKESSAGIARCNFLCQDSIRAPPPPLYTWLGKASVSLALVFGS